ncbi:hypothetical protein [Streptomyces sp. NRRL S-244]|uniref:hypothetical protein n=1 Tax=Streptomyces sp. NRRL S-244 TaxID=1463897 RepID=UPI0004C132F8|nr:hypothetical protein [Streptomyces sp. NRRL S-244]
MEPEDLESAYRWPIPPTAGWTGDDLDLLPDLPPHTELIDGSLVFRSPQTLFHMRTVGFINHRLEALIPPGLEVMRDRHSKPLTYARAEIPHFWRLENNDGRAVVYVYELDPATKAYVATGIFRDRLKVAVPCGIDLDLTAAR